VERVLCGLLSSLESLDCQQLTASKTEESSLEGSTATLSYRYSRQATGSDQFYWYRQYPGKPPEFLTFNLGTQNTTNSKLSVRMVDDRNGLNLQISSAAVTDSAVYYCAVRPTVTGNSKTLYKNLWTVTANFSSYNNVTSLLLSLVITVFSSGEACHAAAEQQSWKKHSRGNIPVSNQTLIFLRFVCSQNIKNILIDDFKFLISHFGTGDRISDPVPGIMFNVSGDKTLMTLQISSAAVTDSAVYYCAVRPTVTGNSKTLYKNLWSKDNRILHNIH
uniref:Ig-like domain-containing protein n=1 Tax=Maylandia zebra TaxID=106582 RepID=A0A3P9D818_9CICH